MEPKSWLLSEKGPPSGVTEGGTTSPEEVTYKQSRALTAAGHSLEAWSLCARESTELCTLFWKRAPIRLLREQRFSVREQPRLTPTVPPQAAKAPRSVLTRDANSFHFEKDYLRLAPGSSNRDCHSRVGCPARGSERPAGPRGGRGGAMAMSPEENSECVSGPGPVTGQSRRKPSHSCWLWSRSPAAPSCGSGRPKCQPHVPD